MKNDAKKPQSKTKFVVISTTENIWIYTILEIKALKSSENVN